MATTIWVTAPSLVRRSVISQLPITPASNAEARYRASADVVIERLGESVLAVQLGTDNIHELNETAARLLELLLDGRTAGEATRLIAAEYDAPLAEVEANVAATVQALVEQQVLEPRPA